MLFGENIHVKMKELGPLGRPLDRPMITKLNINLVNSKINPLSGQSKFSQFTTNEVFFVHVVTSITKGMV